tara:strand:- start:185 stop:6262 length:6078 start_codon:yes stop_codon:yes gene_type:complete
MNINARVFGSPIPKKVKNKLEARQEAASRTIKPNETLYTRGRGNVMVNQGTTYGDLLNNQFGGEGDLSSRTPFVRMWTAVQLREKIDYKDDQKTWMNIDWQEPLDTYEEAARLAKKYNGGIDNLDNIGEPDPEVGYLLPRTFVQYDDKTKKYYLRQEKPTSQDVEGFGKAIYTLTTNNIPTHAGVNASGYDKSTSMSYNEWVQDGRLIAEGGEIGQDEAFEVSQGKFGSQWQSKAFEGRWEREGDTEGYQRYLKNQQSAYDKAFPREHGVENDHNKFMKPPAGIKSINISTEGSLGVIKKTTVNFIVHNFADFEEIYMKYFMRPGAQVFVDYGWSNVPLYSPEKIMDLGPVGEYQLQKILFDSEKGIIPKYQGDLDTLIGIVTDYESRILQDGSVECSVTITSKNMALLGVDVEEKTSKRINFLIDYTIQYEGLFLNSSPNERKTLAFSIPNANSSTVDIRGFKNAIKNLAEKSFGTELLTPGGYVQLSTGIYVNTKHDKQYITWGLLEDKLFNSEFGFGSDLKNLVGVSVSNKAGFESTLDSSETYVRWDEKLGKRQTWMSVADEKPCNWLYPENWGNVGKGTYEISGSFTKGVQDIDTRNVRTYSNRLAKRPDFDFLIKEAIENETTQPTTPHGEYISEDEIKQRLGPEYWSFSHYGANPDYTPPTLDDITEYTWEELEEHFSEVPNIEPDGEPVNLLQMMNNQFLAIRNQTIEEATGLSEKEFNNLKRATSPPLGTVGADGQYDHHQQFEVNLAANPGEQGYPALGMWASDYTLGYQTHQSEYGSSQGFANTDMPEEYWWIDALDTSRLGSLDLTKKRFWWYFYAPTTAWLTIGTSKKTYESFNPRNERRVFPTRGGGIPAYMYESNPHFGNPALAHLEPGESLEYYEVESADQFREALRHDSFREFWTSPSSWRVEGATGMGIGTGDDYELLPNAEQITLKKRRMLDFLEIIGIEPYLSLIETFPGKYKYEQVDTSAKPTVTDAAITIQNPIDWTAVDKYHSRIPLREIFIDVEIVKKAFESTDEGTTTKEAIEYILEKMNEDSVGIWDLKLVSAPGDDTSLSVVDYNFLGKDKNKGNTTQQSTYDELFVFDITGRKSIVINYDLSLNIPSGNIATMLAIQGASETNQSFNLNADIDSHLAFSSVTGNDNERYIQYLPNLHGYRNFRGNTDDIVGLQGFDDMKHFSKQTIRETNVANNNYDLVNVSQHTDAQGYIYDTSTNEKQSDKATIDAQVKVNEQLQADQRDRLKELGFIVTSTFKEYFDTLAMGAYLNDKDGRAAPLHFLKLTLKVYGISSLQPGDIFRVNYLPKIYLNNVYFQVIKVTHDVDPTGWYTTLETVFRVRPDKKNEANIAKTATDSNVVMDSTMLASMQNLSEASRVGMDVPMFKTDWYWGANTSATWNYYTGYQAGSIKDQPYGSNQKTKERQKEYRIDRATELNFKKLAPFITKLRPYINDIVTDPNSRISHGFEFEVWNTMTNQDVGLHVKTQAGGVHTTLKGSTSATNASAYRALGELFPPKDPHPMALPGTLNVYPMMSMCASVYMDVDYNMKSKDGRGKNNQEIANGSIAQRLGYFDKKGAAHFNSDVTSYKIHTNLCRRNRNKPQSGDMKISIPANSSGFTTANFCDYGVMPTILNSIAGTKKEVCTGTNNNGLVTMKLDRVDDNELLRYNSWKDYGADDYGVDEYVDKQSLYLGWTGYRLQYEGYRWRHMLEPGYHSHFWEYGGGWDDIVTNSRGKRYKDIFNEHFPVRDEEGYPKSQFGGSCYNIGWEPGGFGHQTDSAFPYSNMTYERFNGGQVGNWTPSYATGDKKGGMGVYQNYHLLNEMKGVGSTQWQNTTNFQGHAPLQFRKAMAWTARVHENFHYFHKGEKWVILFNKAKPRSHYMFVRKEHLEANTNGIYDVLFSTDTSAKTGVMITGFTNTHVPWGDSWTHGIGPWWIGQDWKNNFQDTQNLEYDSRREDNPHLFSYMGTKGAVAVKCANACEYSPNDCADPNNVLPPGNSNKGDGYFCNASTHGWNAIGY